MVQADARRQVVVEKGSMTIEGLSEPFVQGFGRHCRLSAEDLRLVGGYAVRDGRLEDATRILGRAALVGDSLHRAGFPGDAGPIGLTIRPLAPGEDGRMLLTIGFRDGDGADDGFFVDVIVPAVVFEALRRDLQSGMAQAVRLSATTSLWVRASQREAVPDLPVAWHLGLDHDGRASLPARGLVASLDWSSADAEAAGPPLPEAPSQEETIDQLAAINWSLKQIALALVFLLIIVALK